MSSCGSFTASACSHTSTFCQRKPTSCLRLSCGGLGPATSLKQWPRTLTNASCFSLSMAAMGTPAASARRSWRVHHGVRSAESVAVARFLHLFSACSWTEDESHDSPVLSWPWTDLGWDSWIPLSAQCWSKALIFCSHSRSAICTTTASRPSFKPPH